MKMHIAIFQAIKRFIQLTLGMGLSIYKAKYVSECNKDEFG
jgi:hypothetical protein